MNLKVQLTRALIVSIISLAGFVFLAMMVTYDKIIQFDSTVISFIQGFETPTLTVIMKLFTNIGSTVFIVPLSLLILVFLYKVLKHRSELILFVAVMVGSNILYFLLKLYFHRARPDLHRLIEVSGYSFPSGHATNACTLYGILAFLLWRHIRTRSGRTILIILSVMMIFTIGISRIYLGVHYPSDIVAGYFLSVLWLTTAIWFYQRYQEAKRNKQTSRL
ncbi:MAG TPA: phosphatase PAP2 family protein [Bacillales bacterium]|nr:phosphatase PAP2 family protein [Bacillales bacterium]